MHLCALPFLLRCGNHFSWQDQYARLATLSKTSTLLALDAFSLDFVGYEARALPQTTLIYVASFLHEFRDSEVVF